MFHHPVIIAGGTGERCKPITNFRPKCLIPINGIPILQLQLEQLIAYGYKNVTILLGYMAEEVIEFLDHLNLDIEIGIHVTPVSYSSADRLIDALPRIEHEKLLVIYCDNYLSSQDLTKIIECSENTFVLHKREKGNISVTESGAAYHSLKRSRKNKYVELGYFIVTKSEVLSNFKSNLSLAQVLIEISNKKFFNWVEIDKYISLSNFDLVLCANSSSNFIFLDRDGVVTVKPANRTYILQHSDLELEINNLKGLKTLARYNFLFVVCTNQPAVGLGLITSDQLRDIHRALSLMLIKNNIHVLDFISCEHTWEDKCDCRKPQPGLLLRAKIKFNHLSKTNLPIYIGDQISDRQAAQAAGLSSLLVNNSEIHGKLVYVQDLVNQILNHYCVGKK